MPDLEAPSQGKVMEMEIEMKMKMQVQVLYIYLLIEHLFDRQLYFLLLYLPGLVLPSSLFALLRQ